MERNITISLEKARELYYSKDTTLIGIALQAFSISELTFDYTNIKTFKDACDVFTIDYQLAEYQVTCLKKEFSKASAAMFQLNIIRRALNFSRDLQLTKNPENSLTYYPYNPFITKGSTYYKSDISSGKMEIIGKIKSEGEEYYVLGGSAVTGGLAGVGGFRPNADVGYAGAFTGFLGCANKEIAKYFGRYFGMLITEAKYGDLPDFEVIKRKYQ